MNAIAESFAFKDGDDTTRDRPTYSPTFRSSSWSSSLSEDHWLQPKDSNSSAPVCMPNTLAYRKQRKRGFGLHWAWCVLTSSPLPLVSSHRAGLFIAPPHHLHPPTRGNPDPQLHLHRDLWFIAVGKPPAYWFMNCMWAPLGSPPSLRGSIKKAYNPYKLLWNPKQFLEAVEELIARLGAYIL
jgi:hypothetical protein